MLLNHLLSSLARLLVGYSLASILGVALGVILSTVDSSRSILRAIMGMPTLAWMPVFLVVFGLGNESVIAAIFISAVFAVALNTAQGILLIDKDVIGAAMLDGAGGMRMLLDIKMPCAIPTITAGLRLAIGYSWRALVGAEILAVLIKYGLGKFIWNARYWSDFRMMFVGLGMIAVCGALLDNILKILVKKGTE